MDRHVDWMWGECLKRGAGGATGGGGQLAPGAEVIAAALRHKAKIKRCERVREKKTKKPLSLSPTCQNGMRSV